MPDAKPYPTVRLHKLLDGPSEIEWLVPQLIPFGTYGVLAGESGIGKSWLFMELALSISTGTPFLGHFPVRQGPVLVVDQENSEILLRNRLKKMLKHRKISNTKPVELHYLVDSGAHFSPLESRDSDPAASPEYRRLLETVKTVKPVLTMFDSLIRMHHADENKSNEMSLVFDYVKQLTRECITTCLFSHHLRKSNNNGNGGSGERIRGSSDIRGVVDFTLLADPHERGLVITPDKMRHDEKLPPFKVVFVKGIDKSRFGLDYAGALAPTGIDTKEWLIEYLKVEKVTIKLRALPRKSIIDVSQDQNVCSPRKMDSTLAECLKERLLGRVQSGNSSSYWLDLAVLNGKHA